MTSKFTREELLNIIDTDHVQCGEASALASMALAAMDQKPAIHRYRRKAVEPYGPYPWHYEEFVDLSRPLEGIEDEYYYAAPPAVSGFAVDGEPAENHIGSKNALDAIVSFIKSKSNPTVKCYEEVSEQLFKDNCHGIHSHVIEYILKLGEELEDLRAEQDEEQPAPVVPDGYVMVPKEMTDEIGEAIAMQANCCGGIALDIYDAMLAAAPQPQNSPQNIPEIIPGWIPVSERMPENDGAYLCWDNRYVTTYAFISGAWQANQFIAKNITHWMPLPAAPQEVNRE
ncbi:DUF551 domain-containing protein [Klebsiella aerogenes]